MATIKLLTTIQTAELLGIKSNTLEIWRLQGKGPIYRKIGKSVRYAEHDVEAYIARSARQSTSQKSDQLTMV